jgi:hypothetical protein
MGLLTRYQRINIYTAQTPVILYVLSQLKLLANSYNESALTRTSHVPHDRKARRLGDFALGARFLSQKSPGWETGSLFILVLKPLILYF